MYTNMFIAYMLTACACACGLLYYTMVHCEKKEARYNREHFDTDRLRALGFILDKHSHKEHKYIVLGSTDLLAFVIDVVLLMMGMPGAVVFTTISMYFINIFFGNLIWDTIYEARIAKKEADN